MTPAPPLYDLVLMLDTAAQDTARAKVVADVEAMIAAGGEQVRHDDWGLRALAYPIEHRTEAEYHLFQFHGGSELLARLQRTLHITDGIVRFRIIKLRPGTPDAPDLRQARPATSEPAAVAEPAPS
jgi:small subunit ribosomal protein S6